MFGRGHASPTVVGNRIFLATADEAKREQWVVAFDRQSGKELWKQGLHRGGFDPKCHQKNTQASSTVACDGDHVYAAFCNKNQIWLSAISVTGKPGWRQAVGRFNSRFGFSASPILYRDTVIIAADHWNGGGYLAAVDTKTGRKKWTRKRPNNASYASAIVLNVAGKDQLLIPGCNQVASYDPSNGRPLWSVKGTTESCVGSIVADGDLVFASGGYLGKETIAIRATGRGQVVWRDRQHTYVPSLLAHDGHLYQVNDQGVAICRDAKSGRERWKQRIGGKFSASPILGGDLIYVPSEGGRTTVFKANSQRFERVADNQLGQECFTSPVICGGKVFLRIAERRESLVCIG